LRHHGKFALAAEVVADIALGKEFAAESGRFALGRNGIGHHNIDVGALDGSLMTSLPVKNDAVRGASFIMTRGSVMTWPFLFCVPMIDTGSMDPPSSSLLRTSESCAE
jgi:hypothetical protein